MNVFSFNHAPRNNVQLGYAVQSSILQLIRIEQLSLLDSDIQINWSIKSSVFKVSPA